MGAPVFTTTYRGELLRIPATINAVKAFVPEDRREEFTEAAGNTPAEELNELLADWLWQALDDDPDTVETIARLKTGDHSGTISAKDYMAARGLAEGAA